MTPQQKSDELVERFRAHANTVNGEMNLTNATQCAIICVEEILKADPCNPSKGVDIRTDFKQAYDFWQSVLNELKSRV